MTHLDTSFIVDLLREQSKGVTGPARRLLDELEDEPLALSVFVACELEAGAARSAGPDRERARIGDLLASVPTVFPDGRFAATYGELLHRLQSAGHSMSLMDLLIATTAVVDGATLLTRNPRHFARIAHLEVRSY